MANLFWNPTAGTSLLQLMVGLALAAVLAYILGLVYVKFGDAIGNRRLLARNFVLLAVTTTLIITVVKSSLALSLGLVGALSIVRFRAAIKEPEELAYLFLAISIGLGMGAGQFLVTLVAFIIIVMLIIVRRLLRQGHDQPSVYVTISMPTSQKLDLNQIVSGLSRAGATARLRRVDESTESMETMFEASFPNISKLEEFRQWLRSQSSSARLSVLESRGLVA
ncbi:MAG: DUF4956 domain-containing protein [Verrucomicrobiae bacterium]|nr:DUF4956 domain-containing protein [Verrucomicrobiae bacterium]